MKRTRVYLDYLLFAFGASYLITPVGAMLGDLPLITALAILPFVLFAVLASSLAFEDVFVKIGGGGVWGIAGLVGLIGLNYGWLTLALFSFLALVHYVADWKPRQSV